MLPHQRAWLLAIGRRLRADYDATAEPIPPRLAELVNAKHALLVSALDQPEPSSMARWGCPLLGHKSEVSSDLCKFVRTTAILFKHFSVARPIKHMPSLGVSSLDLGR